MKKCCNGHVTNDDSQKFCTVCGKPLETVVEEPPTPSTDNVPPPVPPLPPKSPAQQKKKGKKGKVVKRVLIAVAAIVVLFFLWVSHMMDSTTYLRFNAESVVFPKCGGETEVNIDYDGVYWEISYKPSWVYINEYDESFAVNCQSNTTGTDREDHITIKSGKIVATLPVGQYGKVQYLRLSESNVTSDKDGGSIKIKIESDGSDPEITYPDFCSISNSNSDGFTLKVNANSSYSRDGYVRVKEDNMSSAIYVSQQGICKSCGGDGESSCNVCMGLGTFGYGFYGSNCMACGGSGKVRCYACGGTGIK